MTEQVIDIRDRIEKMRTQMTGPSTGLKQKENIQRVNENNAFQNKSTLKKSEVSPKSNLPVDGGLNDVDKKIQSFDKKSLKDEEKKSEKFEKVYGFSSFDERKNNASTKTYKDYHSENIIDDKKQSVKLDNDKPFPQFNLNVSNPISWKLMLLIMLMQLLTNIMLVVVLYLK